MGCSAREQHSQDHQSEIGQSIASSINGWVEEMHREVQADDGFLMVTPYRLSRDDYGYIRQESRLEGLGWGRWQRPGRATLSKSATWNDRSFSSFKKGRHIPLLSTDYSRSSYVTLLQNHVSITRYTLIVRSIDSSALEHASCVHWNLGKCANSHTKHSLWSDTGQRPIRSINGSKYHVLSPMIRLQQTESKIDPRTLAYLEQHSPPFSHVLVRARSGTFFSVCFIQYKSNFYRYHRFQHDESRHPL